MGGLLLVGGFLIGSSVILTSPPMTTFLLSIQAGGGSETVGLTNTVLDEDEVSEVDATYPNPVLSICHF
jgi:hypothetical protein